jgi:mitogen-activated protein kinase kinase
MVFPLLIRVKNSLEKQFDQRPSPEQILQHPWVKGMQGLNVNMEKWIKEAWGWR